jgi:hypothetical protein
VEDRIGVVGSPSTTAEVTVDILEDASSIPLHGSLVYLAHPMSQGCLIAVGTVSDILTSNRWHEDPNMRGVLKIHGSLPHLSGTGDVRTAQVLIQAAYLADSADPAAGDPPMEAGGALTMSPTTGARVRSVTDEFLTSLLRRHAGQMTYLGSIYRSTVRLPLTIRHFGSAESGGAGEAYHTGIFGMTGSGKSALAAYLMAAQLQHPELATLIIDPQGQFTSEVGLPFSLQEWAEKIGRKVHHYSVAQDLRLSKDAFLLGDLLGLTRFFKDLLTVKATDNRESAVAEFTRVLQRTPSWDSRDASEVLREALTALVGDAAAMQRIYSSADSRNRLTGAINSMLSDDNEFSMASDLFKPLHSLFTDKNLLGAKRASLHGVLQHALTSGAGPRPLLILDVSGEGAGSELLGTSSVKARILRVICSTLNLWAEQLYKKGGSLNCLVVFDEAQRFAADSPEDDEAGELAKRLVDYVRTTRKYGLGWMFITQEIGSLNRGIYAQLRVKCFGYGLTSGSELTRLRDTVGSQASADLYRSFVDPAAVQPAQYPFMITGPVSPLSFTGAPVFLSVYTDFERFKSDNALSP